MFIFVLILCLYDRKSDKHKTIANLKSKNISTSFYLIQSELKNEDSQSLINKVDYKILDNSFSEIDLMECENINIQVIYGIKKELLNSYESIITFQEKGINIFNINDIFFNDICKIYPDFANDIILEDRVKEIFLNYSVCEEGCTYKEFDKNFYTITCECHIKNKISSEISPIKLEYSDKSSNNLIVAVGSDKKTVIIEIKNIFEIKKIKDIKISSDITQHDALCLYQEEFLIIGLRSGNIYIFNLINNYELMKTINNAHIFKDKYKCSINGIIELSNGSFASYGEDGIIKIW